MLTYLDGCHGCCGLRCEAHGGSASTLLENHTDGDPPEEGLFGCSMDALVVVQRRY